MTADKMSTKKALKWSGLILLGGVVLIILLLISFELMHRAEKAREDAKVFAVSYDQFVDNWNNSNDNFTNGVKIDKSIDDNYEIELDDKSLLQCEHIADSDNYDLNYKRNNADENDYKNALISIFKLIGANVSDEELEKMMSDYKADETISVSVGVSNNKYLLHFISKYITDGDLLVDTETGRVTLDVRYEEFKSRFINEFAQYIAGNDGTVTDEIKKESKEIYDKFVTAYENVSSDYWNGKVTRYEFNFSKSQGWGSVHAKIEVVPETSTLVYVCVSNSNYELIDKYIDCCKIVTKAVGDVPSVIAENLERNEVKDVDEYTSLNVTYTFMTKLFGAHSQMEIYPSEDYQYEDKQEGFKRINSSRSTVTETTATKVTQNESNRTYIDCYNDKFSLVLPNDWTYEIMDNQIMFYEKYNYKNFIDDTNTGYLGCVFTGSEDEIYENSPNAVILGEKNQVTYAFSPPMGIGISSDETANKKLKHALDETESVTDSFNFDE